MSTISLEWKPRHKPIFTADWFTSRIPAFTEWLKDYRNKPCNALEIGCYEGRSTLWFLENILTHKDSMLTVIDTFEGGEEHSKEQIEGLYERFLHNIEPYKDKIDIYKADSFNTLNQLLLQQKKFDFIYVDGSHKAEDVYLDAKFSWELLKPNGIMIFDDYEWKEQEDRPKEGIDKFLFEVWEDILVVNKGYVVFVIKKEAQCQ